jgi:hypothetical protein
MTLDSLTPACNAALMSAVAVTFMCAVPVSATDETAPRIARVRANGDAAIALLLLEAPRRSTTFRRLVEAIDASDGIVYIERGTCLHGVQACLAMSVVVAGPNRILRVLLNTTRNPEELIVAIGHELQHAVEALSDPHVTTNMRIYFFFDRMGPTGSGRFETHAAIQTGLDVEAELRATLVRRMP